MTSAARRASRASSSVQQPRAPVRYVCGLRASARCTPVTSYPASTARAAATAESTPPDMAANTRMVFRVTAGRAQPEPGFGEASTARSAPGRLRPPGALDRAREHGEQFVELGRGRGVAEREPQRRAGPVPVRVHGPQYVRGLR